MEAFIEELTAAQEEKTKEKNQNAQGVSKRKARLKKMWPQKRCISNMKVLMISL